MVTDKVNILYLGSDTHWLQVLRKAMEYQAEVHQDDIDNPSPTTWKRDYNLIVLDTLHIPKKRISPTIASLKNQQPGVKIVVVSASPTWTAVREALKAGATDYIAKSLNRVQVMNGLMPYLQP